MGWEQAVAAFVLVGVACCVLRVLVLREDRRLLHQERQAEIRASVQRAAYQPAYPMLHTLHATEVERKALPGPGAPVGADVPALQPQIPTFGQMREQGLVQPGPQLIIGYREDSTPRYGTWLELYNLLMLGLSGYGKSTAARYLACWHVINGGRLILIDPHGRSGDESLAETLAPLHLAFLCDPAFDAPAAIRSLRLADSIMRSRLNGESTDMTPLLVLIDEVREVMTYSAWKEAAPLAAEYLSVGNTAGRKKRCYTLATSQLATVDQLGGSAVQQSFVATVAFRSKRRQAQILDFEPEEKRRIQRLPVGSGFFMGARSTEPEQLFFPNTTPQDGVGIAALVATGGPIMGDGAAMKSGIIDGHYVAESSPKVASVAISAEARHALQLFLTGKSMAEVVLELRGVRSNEGSKYQRASDEVQDLVRQAMLAQG